MNEKMELQAGAPVPSLQSTRSSPPDGANNSLKSNIKHQTKNTYIMAVGFLVLLLGLYLLRFHGTIPLQKDSDKYSKAGVLQGYETITVNSGGVQIETCSQSSYFGGPNQTITKITSPLHGEMFSWLIAICALGLGSAGFILIRTWRQGWAARRNALSCLIMPLIAIAWYFLQERASHNKLRCVANLFELRHSGEYLYALDNQDRLPKRVVDLVGYVKTYTLICPDDHAPSKTGDGYSSYSYCSVADSSETRKPEICCSIHSDCTINADGDLVIDEVKK